MLQIISGKLKGKKLFSIKGNAVRPTSGRIKESIFNIIRADIDNAVVLDLFSGTGAVGIEALSCGAQFCTFVENSNHSLTVIKKNIATCRLNEKTNIIKWNILQNLNCLNSLKHKFNIVFIDPPYNNNFISIALKNLKASNSLAPDALIITEYGKKETEFKYLSSFHVSDNRKYGKTLVSFLNYMI